MKKSLLVVVLMAITVYSVFAADEGLKIGDTTWKFNGEIRFMYTDQTAYDQNWYLPVFREETDTFNRMYQRYRLGITGEFNEYLSAHYELQVGDEQWGNKNYNEREVNLRTLYAYLRYSPDFLADTSITVGLQGYDDIFQTSVFSDEAVGIIVNHNGEKFAGNIGYLTLRDDDVDQGIYSSAEGLLSGSDTLLITDMNYKLMDNLTVKSAFYYDYWKIGEMGGSGGSKLVYTMAFYGFGADYTFNDNISVGGHFVMRSGGAVYTNSALDETEYEMTGSFTYAYASYSKDKFSAKINFGYTPFEDNYPTDVGETQKVTAWGGAFQLMDSTGGIYWARGNQWVSAYGLEYFGRGEVCDRQAMATSYGDYPGLMVISFNLAYDFAYANYGIMSHTYSDDYYWYGSVDTSIGSELDLGVKTEIMKGLEFNAVYAMFFAGEFFKFGDDDVELENAHEMSMLLRYTF